MKRNLNRRLFIRYTANTAMGVGLLGVSAKSYATKVPGHTRRVGIIGLDTSHSIAFTNSK